MGQGQGHLPSQSSSSPAAPVVALERRLDRHLFGERYSCVVPKGVTYQGRAAPRVLGRGPPPKAAGQGRNAMFFPGLYCPRPHPQDSTLFLIFSLILVQELGEAGDDS